jgi:hypothetical protein
MLKRRFRNKNEDATGFVTLHLDIHSDASKADPVAYYFCDELCINIVNFVVNMEDLM